MWTYVIDTGKLLDSSGKLVAVGYAGLGPARNNPDCQALKNRGPLPAGLYGIEAPVSTATHGPYVLWLVPDPANEMFTRSGFGIHGDSLEHPGLASDGCIIMSRGVRERIWASADPRLQVIASLSDNSEDVRMAMTGEPE